MTSAQSVKLKTNKFPQEQNNSYSARVVDVSRKAEEAAAERVPTPPDNSNATLVVDLSMKSMAAANAAPVSPLTTAALLSIERIKQATTLLGGAQFFPRLVLGNFFKRFDLSLKIF